MEEIVEKSYCLQSTSYSDVSNNRHLALYGCMNNSVCASRERLELVIFVRAWCKSVTNATVLGVWRIHEPCYWWCCWGQSANEESRRVEETSRYDSQLSSTRPNTNKARSYFTERRQCITHPDPNAIKSRTTHRKYRRWWWLKTSKIMRTPLYEHTVTCSRDLGILFTCASNNFTIAYNESIKLIVCFVRGYVVIFW